MQLENPSVKTIMEETDNPALRRVQYGCLIALALAEALFFLIGYALNGVICTNLELYSLVPALIFLGTSVGRKLPRYAKIQIAIAAYMLAWFWVAQTAQRILGASQRQIGMYFCAYALCLPFAAVTGDGKRQRGLKIFGRLHMAMAAVMTFYTVLLLVGAVPDFLKESVYWDGTRLHVLYHPNLCAMMLMISITFSLISCLETPRLWLRVLLGLWIGAQLGMLSMTNGRTNMLFVSALMGGCAFCALRKSGKKRLLIAFLAAAAVVCGVFLGTQKVMRIHKENMPAEQVTVTVQGSWENDIKTLNGRTYIWASARKGLEQNPEIKYIGTPYTDVILAQNCYFSPAHTHNSWLEVLYQLGTPALLGALALTVVAVYDALVVLRDNRDLRGSFLALLILCMLGCSMLEPYLFGNSLDYIIFNCLFMLCLGYLDCWRAELKKRI